ncbi:MAG: hypothetical protein AAGI38_15415 [Bacteroidota bacterium]
MRLFGIRMIIGLLLFTTLHAQEVAIRNSSTYIQSLPDSILNSTMLYVSGSNSDSVLVPEIRYFTKAKRITLIGIKHIPDYFFKLKELEEITILHSLIDSIPDGISHLKRLKKIEILHCPVKKIPSDLQELDSLESLILLKTCVRNIPPKIFQKSSLKTIGFCVDCLEELPYALADSKSIQSIEMFSCCSNPRCGIKPIDTISIRKFRNFLKEKMSPEVLIY